MCKRILSAMVSTQEKTHAMEFSSGINILYGKDGKDVLLTLAGIFGGMPTKLFEAQLQWRDGVTFFISGEDGHVFVDSVKIERGDPARLMKDFHKHRFLNFKNNTHLLDGSRLPVGASGASDLLLKKLNATIAQKDARPLFIWNFMERLDEAVDLQQIFAALYDTGRQIFIAVPHYYKIEKLEGKQYVTTVHNVSTP